VNDKSSTIFEFLQFGTHKVLQLVALIAWIFWAPRCRSVLLWLRRAAVLLLATTLFIVTQLINGLGFLLDEIFFRGYRKTDIVKPVFIVGVPRSGTTTAHRTLATHPAFTTTSAVDCLLTPSVSQRKLLRLLSTLDSTIGAPVAKLIDWLQAPIVRSISANHGFSLSEPEEDFLFLTPLLQCFLLVVPFPRSQWLWKFAVADREPNALGTRLTLGWYRLCVRKHLYCNPQASRYLSKNPSFSGITHRLAEYFPDCQIIICERETATAVRSQFRVLAPLRAWLAATEYNADFDIQLLDTLQFYKNNLEQIQTALPSERVRTLALSHVSQDPCAAFNALLNWIDAYAESTPQQSDSSTHATPEQHGNSGTMKSKTTKTNTMKPHTVNPELNRFTA
jgi:omega-hydroxy-beta-dihydromenaquinone-9 sulfotransferase